MHKNGRSRKKKKKKKLEFNVRELKETHKGIKTNCTNKGLMYGFKSSDKKLIEVSRINFDVTGNYKCLIITTINLINQ